VLPPAIGPVAQTLEGHDLILVVGSSVFPYYPYIPGPLLPEGASWSRSPAIPTRRRGRRWATRSSPTSKLTLEALLEAVAESSRRRPSRTRAAGNPGRPTRSTLDRAHGPRRGLPEDGIVVLESPASTLALRNQLRLSHPGSYYFSAGGGLGFGLPASIGVQLAQPDRPGRLRDRRGLGPVRGDRLLERRRPRRAVTFLVMRNSEYAILKWFAEVESVQGAPGLDLPRLDVAAVAAGYGVSTQVANGRDEVRDALAKALASRGRSWSKSRCSRECPSSRRIRGMTVAAPDRAPDELAGGTAQPLRGDLESLLGPDRVLGRASDIVRYASDASPYRLLPRAVVMARDAADVATTLAYGRANDVPVVFRGGGTSLNGQGQSDGILVDVRRHFGGVAVEEDGALARVKPGTVLGHANRVLAPHGRKLGPDPASTDIATVGGVIANNSGGMRCGTVHDSYSTVRSMTFALPSGTTIDTASPDAAERFAAAEPELAAGLAAIRDEIRADAELSERIRRKFAIKNTTGYRLCAFLDAEEPLEIFRRLVVGSEGTLAFVAEAVFETVPLPARTTTAWIHFPASMRRSRLSATWSTAAPARSS
jgi:hypothetical protein